MNGPSPFPKLPPWDTAKLMQQGPWPLGRTVVFLAAYASWFALGFWLGCRVRAWLW